MKHSLIAFTAIILATVACTQKPKVQDVTIDGAVGKLRGIVERPEAADLRTNDGRYPVAIIYHGLTGYKEENHLNAVNDSLVRAGFATVRFDFNGHGKSEGLFRDMTLENELDDALKIYEWTVAQKWADKDRIFVTGHSQGGLETGLVAGTLGTEKIRGAVLLAPAACICVEAREGSFFGFEFDDEIPESFSVWGNRDLRGEYLKVARELDVYGITARYTGPVLIIQGLSDGPELIRDAYRYTEYLKDVEYIPLEGLSHCFPEDYGTPAALTRDFFLKLAKTN